MVYHPRLLFFLWKVSNPGLVFFLWMVSNPGLVFFLWMVSNPESWHQNLQEEEGFSICGISLIWCCKKSWSWHQNLQEDWLGTKDEIGSSNIHLYNSNLHLDLVPQEIILVMAPKFARGEGGTKVISISLCLYLVSSLVP